MGRERALAATSAADSRSAAVQRHKKDTRYGGYDLRPRVLHELVAKPTQPKLKYQSYFEFQENKDKKKKLEIQVTNDKTPQGGFTFVPVGNPELTNVCKELSREEDALIFIVSAKKEENHNLVEHVHRLGYHFRSYIVDQAALQLGGLQGVQDGSGPTIANKTDAIPESQEDINKQADAAIRDLFPRIPNTDREIIIQHAFQKGAVFQGKPVVGLQADLSLSRRVQLAVIAHIRHTHTRYDQLLRETDWASARRTVEGLCLDILIKWRGDEETGRDQLDEVLREVVVISDSEADEDEDSEDEGEASADDELQIVSEKTVAPTPQTVPRPRTDPHVHVLPKVGGKGKGFKQRNNKKAAQMAKTARKNLKRQKAWEAARKRNLRRAGPTERDTPIDQISRANTGPVSRSQAADVSHPRGQYRQVDQRYTVENRPLPVYEDKVIVRPHPDDVLIYDKGYAQKPAGLREPRTQPPLPRGSMVPQTARSQPYPPSSRDSQDVILPSIEQPVDFPTDSSLHHDPKRTIDSLQGPPREQVMYAERIQDPSYSRVLPSRPEVIYVDDLDMPSKRRRVVLDPDGAEVHSPVDSEHMRLVPRTHPEQQRVPASYRQDARDRNDVWGQRLVIGREPLPSQDSFPTQMRVITRGPDNETSIKVLPVYDESDQPRRPRVHDDVYYETARRAPAPRPAMENERPVERAQQSRSITLERPSHDYQSRFPGEHFLDSSASFSNSRSHEVSHYLPAISRVDGEGDSHHSTARDSHRDDPRSLPISYSRFPPRQSQYDAPRGEEKYRVVQLRDGSRVEERIMAPPNRAYDVNGPPNTTGPQPRRYVRSLRDPGEVIVLD